ncbi:MAG: hypothetical protein HY821_08635 [Acidobacteria bacterium]|nr:hypothetical protein [Acidobacteriota bacterium]
MARTGSLVLAMAALWLCACGGEGGSAPKKAAAKAPEPVGGQTAAFRMYGMARQWAQDVQMLRMENFNIDEVKGAEGTAGAWRAVFVSRQLGKQREFSFAAAESRAINLKAGVFAQTPVDYVGSPQLKPFPMAALKIDSTKAYEVAVKESAEYIKKHPGTPVQFELSFTDRTPNTAWRVVWGPSIGRSDYSVFVDASTAFYMGRSR